LIVGDYENIVATKKPIWKLTFEMLRFQLVSPETRNFQQKKPVKH
jgi:hypothetical protein